MTQDRHSSRSLPERLDAAQRCPNCNDVGWYVVTNRSTGEAEQEQCEFCYTVPDSLFNVHEEVKAALGKQSETQPLEFDQCPDGKPCRQTTTGCLKGTCRARECPCFVTGGPCPLHP
jgi:hypothetical protein